MDEIQFIGLKELEEVDQEMVRKITAEYYPKIQRQIKNITSLVVHIKQYSKGGHRPKYSMHVRAVAPTKILETQKTSEWDLSKALHNAFDDLEREIQHHFHD
ncbi:hypothetical protein JW898_00645 [Candidatus Woesearchaeota archaeon]|nr:hypothetical protein [Candidatus Woesearchaeota archaeon]